MFLLNLFEDLKLDVQDIIISHNIDKNIKRYNNAVRKSNKERAANMSLSDKISEFCRIVSEILYDPKNPDADALEEYHNYLTALFDQPDMHDFMQKLIDASIQDSEMCVSLLGIFFDTDTAVVLTAVLSCEKFISELFDGFCFHNPKVLNPPAMETNKTTTADNKTVQIVPEKNLQTDTLDKVEMEQEPVKNYTKDELFEVILEKALNTYPDKDIDKDELKENFDLSIEAFLNECGKNNYQDLINYLMIKASETDNIDELLADIESEFNAELLDVKHSAKEKTVEPENSSSEVENQNDIINNTDEPEPPVSDINMDSKVVHKDTYKMIHDNLEESAKSFVEEKMSKVVEGILTEPEEPKTTKRAATYKKKK